jgi:hypothetical protein
VKPRPHFETAEAPREDVYGAGNEPCAPAILEAVRGELEKMLGSALFAQSNRCKNFLHYVVGETLDGRGDQLKERTIGVNVFDRAYDYDTGDDSVVRVTANDVRKRIGQYYQECQTAHAVLIDLPRGSYLPVFHLQQKKRGGRIEEKRPLPGNGSLPEAAEDQTVHAGTVTDEAAPEKANPDKAAHEVEPIAAARTGKPARRLLVGGAIALAVAGVAALGIWRSRVVDAPPPIWEAFSRSGTPVLICLGEHDVEDPGAPAGLKKPTIATANVYRQMIPVDDASVIAALANQLGKRGIPFRLAAAEQISFTEFQRQPVILIGAVDNEWALRLSQALRYRIAVTYPSGPGNPPVASIVDAASPDGNNGWSIDFSAPVSAWKKDYAILARVDDATSGVPVLMEAGLGSAGSIAASELLLSGGLAGRLKEEARCAGKTNFEAVVGTDIIEGKPGPPHLLSLDCW